MHVWVDGQGKRLRVDVYDGLDSTITTQVRVWQLRAPGAAADGHSC